MKPLLSLLRRLSFAALLGAATAWAGPSDLRAAQDAGFQRGLERVVQQLGLSDEVAAGHLSLALVDVSKGAEPRLAMLNGDRMMYAASMPKLAILLGAFVEAEAGHLALDPEHLEAMTNMIRRSSNEDATRVLHWVGGERLIDILESARFRFYEPGGAGGLWVGNASPRARFGSFPTSVSRLDTESGVVDATIRLPGAFLAISRAWLLMIRPVRIRVG